MPAGRPKGSGKRWTDFQQRDLWTRIEFIMWRDGHRDARRAVLKLLRNGYFSVSIDNPVVRDPITNVVRPDPTKKQSRKVWAPHVNLSAMSDARRQLIESCRPVGGQREAVETLRKKYSSEVSRRYRTDAAFRSQCDFYLSIFKEAHETGDSTEDVFARR